MSTDVLNNSKKRDMVRWVDCSLNICGSSRCGWRCHHLFLMKSHPGDKMANTAEDGRSTEDAVTNLSSLCAWLRYLLNFCHCRPSGHGVRDPELAGGIAYWDPPEEAGKLLLVRLRGGSGIPCLHGQIPLGDWWTSPFRNGFTELWLWINLRV